MGKLFHNLDELDVLDMEQSDDLCDDEYFYDNSKYN